MKLIRGSIVALVTPMHASGDVDWDALDKLIAWHIKQGTNAIVVAGTTGESATLNYDEHCQVIAASVKAAGGAVPVIAGTGANSTREAIDLTKAAAQLGADACLLITPYYNKPTQEGLYQHYMAIAERVNIPQILYNVPSRTAVDLLPETVLRLSKIDNIVGIKEATGSLERSSTISQLCGSDFLIYSGDDAIALEMILEGGMGSVSVTANVAPQLMSQMCAAALVNDVETAISLNQKLMPLHEKLFVETNPIPVKWSLQQLELIQDGIRLPLTNLDTKYHAQLKHAMEQVDICKIDKLEYA
jgi:4-hydroxy-tetrahydrodipicolinate synthase